MSREGMSRESLLAGSFDSAYGRALREAEEADAASSRAREALLSFSRGAGGQPSDWPGHAGGGPAAAAAGAARPSAGEPVAPCDSELALASLLALSEPRSLPRSGPAGDGGGDGPDARKPAGVPPAGLGAAVSAAAGVGFDSGRHGRPCVDLYELDPTVRWWRVDNAYIYFGYRKPPPARQSRCAAACAALGSLFYPLHNQTANVWTHLCGACIVATLGARTLGPGGPLRGGAPHGASASALDLCAAAGFLCSAFACLSLSATFHLLCDASLRLRRFLIKLDFAGVLCLVWGSWLPLLQFGLACRDARWRLSYAAVITGGVLVVAILCLLPRFATPAYQPVRAAVFLFIGWVGAVPAVQLLLDPRTRPVGIGVVKMGLFYSAGTAIDVMRVPERFFYEAAPPSLVLSAVGGASDDGVRGSSVAMAGEGGAKAGGAPSPAAGAPPAGRWEALELGRGGSGHGGGGGGAGLVSPVGSDASAIRSFGSMGQLPLRPNTVTATILGSGSALDLVSCGPVGERIERQLCELAAGGEADAAQQTAAPAAETGRPPQLAASASMLDHVRAAQRNARAQLGGYAPLLSLWGSHATFHCFVVGAVLTHFHTTMIAWEFKAAHCMP